MSVKTQSTNECSPLIIITREEARVVTRVRQRAKNKARPPNQRTLITGATTVYRIGEQKVKNKSVNRAPKHQRSLVVW